MTGLPAPAQSAARASLVQLNMRQLAFIGVAMLAAACAQRPATATPSPLPPPPAATAPAFASTTVILVRHAEKADASADPVLSAAGAQRAALLADSLAHAGISAIVVTQFQRTRLTAQPLASRLGITPSVVAAGSPGVDHAAAVAALIRDRFAGQTVLVVGHSNSVPAIIKALGVTAAVAIADWEYDDLFVVKFDAAGQPALVRSRYGAASMAPAAP